MQRLVMLTVVFCGIAATPAQLLAVPRWCVANHPDAVFCEDWDRYCNAMLNDPVEACPEGSNNSEAYWLANDFWQSGSFGCSSLSIEDAMVTTWPFSGRAASKGDLGYTSKALGTFIRAKFGTEYVQIMGTDESPIVLDFVMDSPANKFKLANMYMELTNATDQPLTDYILSDNCNTACGGIPESPFPIICRQSPTPSSGMGTCPPVATATILPSIAAGGVSFLDTNPCHCEGAENYPVAEHLSFFDGKQWWTLSNSLVPSTFPGSGDFKVYSRTWLGPPGPNRVVLTIKLTTVKVELYHVTPSNPATEYSWCEIPRQYLGPFFLLKFGYAQPCKLKNGLWECQNIRQCWNQKSGCTTTMDNILVAGGIGYAPPGACCIVNENGNPPSISCVPANGELDCTGTYGGQFKGSGTICDTTPCCPPFLPDHDMDGDVDLEDFGWFQTCLSAAQFVDPPTVPCNCANLDGDVDVDSADFGIFADCLSGPGVPANTNCMN